MGRKKEERVGNTVARIFFSLVENIITELLMLISMVSFKVTKVLAVTSKDKKF